MQAHTAANGLLLAMLEKGGRSSSTYQVGGFRVVLIGLPSSSPYVAPCQDRKAAMHLALNAY